MYEILKSLGACREGLEWAARYSDPQKAWDECPDGYWMWWWASKVFWTNTPGSQTFSPIGDFLFERPLYQDAKKMADDIRANFPAVPMLKGE